MAETMNATKLGNSFAGIIDTNKQELAKIEQYKNEKISTTPRNLVFTGLCVGGLFMAGMFALQIISGIIAIGALAVVGVGGFMGLRWLKAADPMIRQKTKNHVLKMMMEEARNNAIYQLENQVITNTSRLRTARDSRDKLGASIETLKKKINPANKGTPIYEQKLAVITRMEEAYNQVKLNLEKGAEANKTFERKVVEYKDMEQFARLAGEAMSIFEKDGSHKLEDRLSLESFNHIDSEFSSALISIENYARDMSVDSE